MNDQIARLYSMAEDFPSIWKRRSRGDTRVKELLTSVISNLEFIADQICSEVRESHIVKRTNVVHYTSLEAAMSMLDAVANEASNDDAGGRLKAAMSILETVANEVMDTDTIGRLKVAISVLEAVANEGSDDDTIGRLKAAMSILKAVVNEVTDNDTIGRLKAAISILKAVASGRSKAAFRLYDTVHLNDPNEGRYLFRRLARRYEWFGEATLRKAYIGSFITPADKGTITPIDNGESDDLAFWRAYGRDGTGCSFSLSIPSDMALGVRYGSEEADKTTTRLKPLLEPLNRIVETAQTRVDRAAVRTVLANAVAKSLEPIRYLYKSDAYAYEKECRVVRLANDNQRQVRFECQTPYGSPAYIRHYCEPDDLLLRKLLVSGTSIVIGPRVPEPESVKSCFETLRNRAKLGSTIRLSKILYQSF